jgi:hypothetical protein
MHQWYDSTEFLSIRLPCQGDPWETADSSSRVNDYYAIGPPWTMMQGILSFNPFFQDLADGELLRAAYLSLKGPSPFKLEVTDFDPAAGSVDLRLEVVDDPGDTSSMVIRTVIYEDNLEDWHGNTRHWITRDFLDDEPVTVAAVGDVQQFHRTFVVDPVWKPDDLVAVGMVQDDADKEIHQASSSYPRPSYSLDYTLGRTHRIVPASTPVIMDDVTLFNVGTDPDAFHVRLVEEHASAGFSVLLSDGSVTHPSELDVSLAASESYSFHLEVQPSRMGSARYVLELYQDARPDAVHVVPFVIMTPHPILLVDDDGIMDWQDYYVTALDGTPYPYAVWPRTEAALPADALQNFCIVIWHLGESLPSLDQADRALLGAWLEDDGKLFVSGQDLGYDLVQRIGGEAQAWYEANLHATYVADSSMLTSIEGVTADPIGDGLLFNISNQQPGDDGANNQTNPSEIAAGDAFSSVVLNYAGSGAAAVKADTGTGKTVYLAFGFEGVDNAANRQQLMDRILSWLGIDLCPCPQGMPARLMSLKQTKSGGDLVFEWELDGGAESGYNIYQTDDRTLLPALRTDTGCFDCVPILALEPGPRAVYAGGVGSGAGYYQILGVCDLTHEGPN